MTKDEQNTGSSAKVSNKSTKTEIFSAYEELLKQFQENAESAGDRQKTSEQKQKEGILKFATEQNAETVIQNISALEKDIRKYLAILAESLLKEVEKLRNVRSAVTMEEKYLEEIHGIKVEADTLADLIRAHKEKKIQLEEEYEINKKNLHNEIAAQKEEWQREENEYEYEVKLKHKKEEDDYIEKKTSKERILKEREEKLAQQENELISLRNQAINFEKVLKEAVAKAQKETADQILKEEHTKAKILEEKNIADKRIADLTINAHQERIKELDAGLKQIKKELEIANQGVKDVAIKVIEGNSRIADQHRNLRLSEVDKPIRLEKMPVE